MFPISVSAYIQNLSDETLGEMVAAGIEAVEMGSTYDTVDTLDFKRQVQRAAAAGLKIWSVHLPFNPFDKIDPSAVDPQKRQGAQEYFKDIIRRAAEAGITKYVIHPSGEPISPDEREARLQAAEESVKILSDYAHSLGGTLCVENIPRTCLGNGIAEMKRLLDAGEHARMCFDVNHNLFDDNLALLEELGDRVVTLHISDYDRVDERHWLPGEGSTDWYALYAKLKEAGYNGVWNYELGREAPDEIVRPMLEWSDYVENARAIFEGREIPKLYSRKREYLLTPRDTLWLGANYYPEDWDEDELETDIAKMKEMGFNVVRIGEFAWKKDEPQEGEYHFEWLHRVVDAMGAAGIKTIMGTPTATPPHWLLLKYPDIAAVDDRGIRRSHGGRRHCCSSNPHYQYYCDLIVEKLGEEFGKDPNVIGWQLDNEIKNPVCHCDYCKDNFHGFLKEKYGTVAELNKEWNLNLFSQAYDSFEEIPLPVNGWHNPHIIMDWELSQSQNHIDFIHRQADILQCFTETPIGTDTMPDLYHDYRKMNDPLDVAQFNHYDHWENLEWPAMWMDYMREFSKIPFWTTETQASWNGSTAPGKMLQPENFIYMNTWLPFMLGGEANLYWLWRTHWAGHELGHGAVLESSGRFTYAAGEIKQAGEELRKVSEYLCSSTVRSTVAFQMSALNQRIRTGQLILRDMARHAPELKGFYGTMLKSGLHPHVIDSSKSLTGYKLLVTPLCHTLEEGDFEDRIKPWLESGGVWVAGPLTDIRNRNGAAYKKAPYGFLETLTGARRAYFAPDAEGRITFVNEEGQVVECNRSYEFFEKEGLEPWITVKEGHQVFMDKTVVAAAKVGKGWVVLLGTFPQEEELIRIYQKAARLAHVEPYEIFGEGAFVTYRKGRHTPGANREFWIVASLKGKECGLRFEGKRKDLLTGQVYEGSIALKPFQVALLQETEN